MTEAVKQDQANEQDQVVEEVKEFSIEDKIAELESKLEAKYKSQIQGLDKKVSEQTKKLQDAELAKLDEKTRAAEEIKLAQEERDRIKSETDKIRRERVVEKALHEAGLDSDLLDRIKGGTEDEIKADVQKFADLLEGKATAKAEATVNAKLAGKGPVAGGTDSKAKTLDEIEAMTDPKQRVEALEAAGYL